MQQMAERQLDGNVVHVYPTDRPHVTEGWPLNECWCEPEIQDYRDSGGGVIVCHRKPTFN